MVSRATNENISSVFLVILPENSNISGSKVADELEKFGSVKRVRIWSGLDSLLALVEVENEEIGRKMISATNGSLTVDEEKWTVCTVKEYEEHLKIVEGPSPIRTGNRPPPATVENLRSIYSNYMDSRDAEAPSDDVENSAQPIDLPVAPPTFEYHWIDKEQEESEQTSSLCGSAPQSTIAEIGSVSHSASFNSSVHYAQPFVPRTAPSINETPPTFTWRPIQKTSHPWTTVAPPLATPLTDRLPPPYHYLPEGPFFRNAKIVPPPIWQNEGLPVLQRITNRYLASMKAQDDKDSQKLDELAKQDTIKLFCGFNNLPVNKKMDQSQSSQETRSPLWKEMEQLREKKAAEESWSPWKSQPLDGSIQTKNHSETEY